MTMSDTSVASNERYGGTFYSNEDLMMDQVSKWQIDGA